VPTIGKAAFEETLWQEGAPDCRRPTWEITAASLRLEYAKHAHLGSDLYIKDRTGPKVRSTKKTHQVSKLQPYSQTVCLNYDNFLL
jgi:hypothetical protein